MRSIAAKLTLAFLLVGLTGALLVAAILRQRTRLAFDQFILTQDQQVLTENLETYYQEYGSWEAVRLNLPGLLDGPQRNAPGVKNFHRDHIPFILINLNRTVIYSREPAQIGVRVSSQEFKRSIPVEVSGKTVGYLILAPTTREFTDNSPEAAFLANINRAALISALAAAGLALLLGGFLAFTMTRSLRELTEATIEIARGRLGRQVKVRSQDELGELATSFNQMSLDLERATQARRQMTADIAHDLRTPLSVLSGYAEALSDGKLPGTPEVYTILHQETAQLSRLVDDLRTLSLADTGELSLNLVSASPQALLDRVAARHAIAARQKGITLKVELAESGGGQAAEAVRMDPDRMAQVLDNLVVNAFRFTPAGGEVVLAHTRGDGGVQLQVRDNGSGIAAEDLAHIFDRSYRGDKARQPGGESGLGLAIAKSIVELHGGRIAAESAPGEGAAFTITLREEPHNLSE